MASPSPSPYEPVPADPSLTEESEDILPKPVELDTGAKCIFFILGCAVLLFWNVIITALPFFLSRLESSPHLKLSFTSSLASICNVVSFVTLGHATFFRKKAVSPSLETRTSILTLAGLMFMFILSTQIHVPAGIFATFVLLVGAVQAISNTYLQKAVMVVGSLFGPSALQPILSGQAAVAVVISIVQVVSAAVALWSQSRELVAANSSNASAEERSAFIFFSFSTAFLLFCALAHASLVRTPLYQRIAGPLEKKALYRTNRAEERRGLVASEDPRTSLNQSQATRVVKENVAYEFAVAYVFIITLSVFPPITTSILPVNSAIHPLLFSSIHFLVFNTGDLLGRYICSFPYLRIWPAKRLLMYSLLRTLFIPLLLMCNVQRSTTFTGGPPLINSDFLYMLILLALGTSNGYLVSMSMISASSLEHNPMLRGRKEDVDTVATIMVFSLVGGLFIGSIASFGVKAAVCNCNPFTG